MKNLLFLILFFTFSPLSFSQTVIKMNKEGGVYTVPCSVNGLKLKFIFDTGASSVSISLTEAQFMLKNGYLSMDDYIGNEYYQIANGDIEIGYEFNLKKIEIGGRYLYNIKASVSNNSKAPLLLGQSALSKLGKFQFDYSNSSLIILDGNNYSSNLTGCISGDCENGYGTYRYKEGDVYKGYFINKKREGKGEYIWSYGDKYVGEWENGKQNGEGTRYYQNGNTYIGGWVDAERSGYGELIFVSGNIYKGSWKNGVREGKGVFTWIKGDRYTGDFKDDEITGFGVFDYNNGNRYEGQWKNLKREGIGILFYKDGKKEAGGWRDDKYIGGGCVSGNCNNGYGTYYYTNAKYVGDFVNGREHGKGVLSYITGEIYNGEFKNGEFIGNKSSIRNVNSNIDAPNNDKTKGCVSGNCINGYGIYNYNNGEKYEGNFKDGLKSGQGRLTYTSGIEYLGYFFNDKPHGKGTLIYLGGDTKSGNWEDGKLIN